jgi:hypothetical protein
LGANSIRVAAREGGRQFAQPTAVGLSSKSVSLDPDYFNFRQNLQQFYSSCAV